MNFRAYCKTHHVSRIFIFRTNWGTRFAEGGEHSFPDGGPGFPSGGDGFPTGMNFLSCVVKIILELLEKSSSEELTV